VYEKILDRINLDGNDTLGIETVFYYVDSLAKCQSVLNKGFLLEYLTPLSSAIKKKLLTSGENLYRNVRKDRLDSLISSLMNGLLIRVTPYRERECLKNMLSLELASHLLSLNFLERRIDGAKFIQDLSKTLNTLGFNSQNTSNSAIRIA
jgi:hypothetical protein